MSSFDISRKMRNDLPLPPLQSTSTDSDKKKSDALVPNPANPPTVVTSATSALAAQEQTAEINKLLSTVGNDDLLSLLGPRDTGALFLELLFVCFR